MLQTKSTLTTSRLRFHARGAMAAAFALAAVGLGQSPGDARTFRHDVDQDGLTDVLTLDAGGRPVLLTNLGNGLFDDRTERSGLGGLSGVASAAWTDFDLDGLQDVLFVVPEGTSRLFLGRADGTFQASSVELPGDLAWAEWSDHDGDGLPDLFAEAGGRIVVYANRVGALAPVFEAPGAEALGSGSQAGFPLNCLPGIEDTATGECLRGSSVPTLGRLYPISSEWYVDATRASSGSATSIRVWRSTWRARFVRVPGASSFPTGRPS